MKKIIKVIFSFISGILSFFIVRYIEKNVYSIILKTCIEETFKSLSIICLFTIFNKKFKKFIPYKISKYKSTPQFIFEFQKIYNFFLLNSFIIYLSFAITENIIYYYSYPSLEIYYRFLSGFLIHINTAIFFIFLMTYIFLHNKINYLTLTISYFILIIISVSYHYLNNILIYNFPSSVKILYIANPSIFCILIIGIIFNYKNKFLNIF